MRPLITLIQNWTLFNKKSPCVNLVMYFFEINMHWLFLFIPYSCFNCSIVWVNNYLCWHLKSSGDLLNHLVGLTATCHEISYNCCWVSFHSLSFHLFLFIAFVFIFVFVTCILLKCNALPILPLFLLRVIESYSPLRTNPISSNLFQRTIHLFW